MKKKALALILVLILTIVSVPVMAAEEEPVVFSDTITVTEDGGKYQIGFVTVEFKKDFLDESMLPATFDVQIYAINGVGYIEFSPDTPEFAKKVHIRVDAYEGPLYDKALGQNIDISIKKQQLIVEHFSIYAFWR